MVIHMPDRFVPFFLTSPVPLPLQVATHPFLAKLNETRALVENGVIYEVRGHPCSQFFGNSLTRVWFADC